MKHLAQLLFLSLQTGEPPEAMPLARRAYESARGGSFEAAVRDLNEAARLAPKNALYRSALGGIYMRQNKLEEAVEAFSAAVRLDPSNATLRGNLETASLEWGAALAKQRRYRAGLILARNTAKLFPRSASAQLMLGLFETRNHQNVNAVAAYRKALDLDPSLADASVGLGIAQSSAGLLKQAKATFEAGLKAFPDDAMHRQAYGVLLVKLAESGLEPAQHAARMLESALQIDPALAEAYYQLGNLAMSREDAASAMTHYSAAMRNLLDDSRVHYAAARALRRLGRVEDAERHLRLFRERKASEEAETPRQ